MFSKIAFLLFLFGATQIKASPQTINSPNCGIKGPHRGPRVVNGEDAARGEIRWIGNMGWCGLSLISSQWVLSAAHCAASDVAKYQILLGAWNRTNPNESSQQVFSVVKQVLHPGYDSGHKWNGTHNVTKMDHDILLLKLDREVDLSSEADPESPIGTVCLPEADEPLDAEAGHSALVSGWGRTSWPSWEPQDILQAANLTIWSNAFCLQLPELISGNGNFSVAYPVSENMVCANAYNRDACKGDSGGPLTVYRPRSRDQATGGANSWFQYGVVSWGKPCAYPYQPARYTRVSRYVSWIKEVLAENP